MITAESGYLSDEEAEKVNQRTNKKYFNTNLHVYNDHFGPRPGELHGIIGPSGGGKSSFVRTTLFQLLVSAKGLLYLSEEPTDKYVLGLNKAFKEAVSTSASKDHSVFMERLKVFSELGMDEFTKKNLFKILKDELLNFEAQFFVFDNLTTSFLAQVGVAKEAAVVQWFKNIAKELDIPVFIVMHTEKGTSISKGAFSSENVRGNATSALMASYIYVVMIVHNGPDTRSFVLTDKARYHPNANKKVYEMNFDKDLGLITKDLKSSQAELAKAINDAAQALRPKKEKKGGW